MRQLVFLAGPGVLLVCQVVVDFAVRNDQLAIDFALAQANHGDLVADFLAEAGISHAILLQRLTELRQIHLVAAGDAVDRLIQLRIVDPQPGLGGSTQLHALHDQPLEHLAFQHILRRQGRTLPLQLLERRGQPPLQFDVGNHLVANHGHDAVGLKGLLRCSRRERGKTRRGKADEDQHYPLQG